MSKIHKNECFVLKIGSNEVFEVMVHHSIMSTNKWLNFNYPNPIYQLKNTILYNLLNIFHVKKLYNKHMICNQSLLKETLIEISKLSFYIYWLKYGF
jgi:hypothetical protein